MRGKLLTWTVVRMPPPGHPKDRVVGLVELEGGRRVFAVSRSEEGLEIDVEVVVASDDVPRFELPGTAPRESGEAGKTGSRGPI